MRNNITIILVVMTMVLLAGCSRPELSLPVSPVLNQYVLKIDGTTGLTLNLLLIIKKADSSIERETVPVTIPFSKEFMAVKCAAWLDAEFRDQKGDYRMILTTNGKAISEVSGNVEIGHKSCGLVHDL